MYGFRRRLGKFDMKTGQQTEQALDMNGLSIPQDMSESTDGKLLFLCHSPFESWKANFTAEVGYLIAHDSTDLDYHSNKFKLEDSAFSGQPVYCNGVDSISEENGIHKLAVSALTFDNTNVDT